MTRRLTIGAATAIALSTLTIGAGAAPAAADGSYLERSPAKCRGTWYTMDSDEGSGVASSSCKKKDSRYEHRVVIMCNVIRNGKQVGYSTGYGAWTSTARLSTTKCAGGNTAYGADVQVRKVV